MPKLTNTISGECAERFKAVGEAFEASFADHGELGAAVSIWSGGQKVVDLWGGSQSTDGAVAWSPDTVVNVWSTTKGITGACFALLVERGKVSYEDLVTRYWPEFGINGKAGVTVGMLLSHQAGLTGFATPATMEDLYDPDGADRLAAQAPFWPIGEGAGYHAITYGTLASRLCRNVDGRSIRQFVAEELAGKLGLDISIGVSSEQAGRVADLESPPGADFSGHQQTPAQFAAHSNPVELASNPLVANTAAWRAAELPGANGMTNARALADLYSRFLPSSPNRFVSDKTMLDASKERWAGVDLVNGAPCRWAAGFQGNMEGLFGPNAMTFGHGGRGGSFGFADPEADVAMGYTMNRMAKDGATDRVRRDGLIQALYASLWQRERAPLAAS